MRITILLILEKLKDGDSKLENKLNDLSGSQWLFWTNTIYETNFPPDLTHRLRRLHGAMKPPELMADIIRFFTKAGELILDPFAGVGGTILGAMLAERQAVGIELNPAWIDIYQEIVNKYELVDGQFVLKSHPKQSEFVHRMILGDCIEQMKSFPDQHFAAIITDPPYGCYHGPSGFKKETNFNMLNIDNEHDFGNAANYSAFFHKVQLFGVEAYRVLKSRRYLVLLIGDRFHDGEYYPLGYRVAEVLRSVGFKWKGIRIWWNKATQRPLKPYAIKQCFIPNITHQNIIIMRKE